MPPAEDVEGQVAIAVVITIEVATFLLAIERIVGGVEVDGLPRRPETRPRAPRARYADTSRFTCRTVTLNSSAARACLSSRSATRRITASRSRSLPLIATMSPPTRPPPNHQPKRGHSNCAQRGHLNLGLTVVEGSWLNQSDDVIVGHGISLLRWRSEVVKQPHDMPPSRFPPSPTSSHSSSSG